MGVNSADSVVSQFLLTHQFPGKMSSGKHKREAEDREDKLTSASDNDGDGGGPSAAKRIKLDQEEGADLPVTTVENGNPSVKSNELIS